MIFKPVFSQPFFSNPDNDEKYELSDNDRFTNKTLNLKLATEENINNLFNVSQRDGFDLEWFSNSNYDVASKINNYTDFVLKSKYDIDVYPKWTLHTPKINNITTISFYGIRIFFSINFI